MDLRKFDVFPKLDNEFRVGTTYGGILSLLSILMTIFLSISEVHSYMNPPIRQQLVVDTRKPTGPDGRTISVTSQPRLDVHLNITFPYMPCYLLHFDVLDPVTQLALPLEQVNSTFTRLDQTGNTKGTFDRQNFFKTDPVECGHCYSANNTFYKCCNTCDSVFDAYLKLEFRPPVLKEIDQCSPVMKKIAEMEGEGCSIDASFKTLRVQSEFHVAPGLSWNSEGWHIHEMRPFDRTFENLNLSHTIHRMSFSESDKPMPLDNFTNIQTEEGQWRVVYTADILHGNFSASRYSMYNPRQYTPGAIFRYDVSPISAVEYCDREPFLHLCTRLLTVIGGVLGFFRLVDTALFAASRSRKVEDLQ